MITGYLLALHVWDSICEMDDEIMVKVFKNEHDAVILGEEIKKNLRHPAIMRIINTSDEYDYCVFKNYLCEMDEFGCARDEIYYKIHKVEVES